MTTDFSSGMFRKYRTEILLTLVGMIVTIGFTIVQRMLLSNSISPDIHGVGVPLDDVYIHARFAGNLLHGNGYAFNPGTSISSDTSPLWVFLLAAGGLFTSHIELVAVGLSALAFLAIGPGVYRVSRDVFGFPEHNARLAGLLAVISSRLAWSGMSGMETALAALLMLLVVEEHERSRSRARIRPREGLWVGLALMLRPEFLFVAVVLAGDWIIADARHPVDRSKALITIVVAAMLASPAFLIPMLIDGSIFSHSSMVQGARISIVPNVSYLWFAVRILASNNGILFLLVVLGLWFLRRQRRFYLLYIIALGLPLLQAFVAPQFRHHGRYFFPVFPLIVMLGVAAWQEIEKKIHPTTLVKNIIVTLAILAGLIETGRWSLIAAESVRNIDDQHLAVVAWLRNNMQPSDTLAVDDVGAIGYFLNKPVIDLTGLMTPTLWPLERNQDSVWRVSRTMGANLYVIYNRLNPAFYEDHKDSLVQQRSFSVRLPLASSADTTMSIYRIRRAVP